MAHCTPLADSVPAENDLVGPGVLTAFLATAAITYFTVIYAYMSDALDKDLTTPFDARGVRVTSKILTRLNLSSRNPPPDTSSIEAGNTDRLPDPGNKAWKDAISKFLISLSDQQLVTGLAVLIAAISRPGSISGYDFSVAVSLGWFSCTTHLATIYVHCVHFKRHRYLRDVRVACLVCLMGLLTYAFIRSTSITDNTIPVDCPENAPWIWYTDIISLLPIWVDYFNAVLTIYLGPAIGFWDIVVGTWSKLRTGDVPGIKELIEIKIESQSEEIERLIERSEKHGRRGLASFLYDGSFLGTFPAMTYRFCYGIAQIVAYMQDSPPLSPKSTEVGFGQITVLLLLVLPVLAMGEAYTSHRNGGSGAYPKSEAASVPVSSEEDDHELRALPNPQQATQAYPQTSEATDSHESLGRRQSGLPSQSATGPSLEATHADRPVDLARNHSNVSATPQGRSHRSAHATSSARESQFRQNVKDIQKYFPLKLKSLALLDEGRELTSERLSLLHRYELVKSAEVTFHATEAIALFTLHLCLGIAAPVFLRSASSTLLILGTVFNILLVFVGNFKSFHRLVSFLRKKKNDRLTKG